MKKKVSKVWNSISFEFCYLPEFKCSKCKTSTFPMYWKNRINPKNQAKGVEPIAWQSIEFRCFDCVPRERKRNEK